MGLFCLLVLKSGVTSIIKFYKGVDYLVRKNYSIKNKPKKIVENNAQSFIVDLIIYQSNGS